MIAMQSPRQEPAVLRPELESQIREQAACHLRESDRQVLLLQQTKENQIDNHCLIKEVIV